MKIPAKSLFFLVVIVVLASTIAFKALGIWQEHTRELPPSEEIYKSAAEIEPGGAPM